jgi:glycosyltransferase involved in cell wall biosynthesis
MDRLREIGVKNTKLLIQGVDSAVFSPQSPRAPDGAIRIFSGGKFEYRKGQDLVIAAFREFVKSHPEAHLVCAWHNPWPQLFRTMANSGVINTLAHGETQPEFFRSLLHNNGISDSQFTILPQLSQHDLAREMANTDFGLFPNRCEGGTNLVLMEYAALGREIVANVLTGHADVENAISMPIEATEDENHWALQPVANITDAMRDAADYPRSDFTGCSWTWEDAAKTVLSEIDNLS